MVSRRFLSEHISKSYVHIIFLFFFYFFCLEMKDEICFLLNKLDFSAYIYKYIEFTNLHIITQNQFERFFFCSGDLPEI